MTQVHNTVLQKHFQKPCFFSRNHFSLKKSRLNTDNNRITSTEDSKKIWQTSHHIFCHQTIHGNKNVSFGYQRPLHATTKIAERRYWCLSCRLMPQFTEWLEKAGRTSSHRLDGHYEERPIIPPQPQCGRCHRDGTGQTTLEVTGSKHWTGASRTMMMIMIMMMMMMKFD